MTPKTLSYSYGYTNAFQSLYVLMHALPSHHYPLSPQSHFIAHKLLIMSFWGKLMPITAQK